ncbi:MAG: hypothetical protein AAGC68_15570, partial [Verrucomicrobiota bacterium]
MKGKNPLLVGFLVSALSVSAFADDHKGKDKKEEKPKPKAHPTGYTDTPFLPGGKWRVHDDARPRPEVVTPGETSSAPPSDAIVLFGGESLEEWSMEKDGSDADWIVRDGYLEVPPKGEGVGGYIRTKREFDVQLDVAEFPLCANIATNSFPFRRDLEIAISDNPICVRPVFFHGP